ncbi:MULTISPECIES: hypothetical protein [Clostridioides]|uniref:hypothetical protein n=1 Tax=Clostridioides TaxID=1870884 RepID=UPI001179B473|nr:hypothetical protein [Clostridioides difficile]MCC0680410.1 hypothetical protein [Clostridioides sp. ES-S-0005-03]UDN46633.1 hypothetical protein JJJ25_13850 [Clostridioides sp. ES-S-0173-01]MBH7477713.1 hypothetical protein [Clostridioides difficile]MBY1552552.1 hypothetical protein [Clostridioides difficile]MCW0761898.1 hypothetical protein [Clostridioides difficile]
MEEISINLLCAVAGVIISYLAFRNSSNKKIQDETETTTKLEQQINFLCENVRDIKHDITKFNASFLDISERVVKVEASTKQAHLRIDELVKKIGG